MSAYDIAQVLADMAVHGDDGTISAENVPAPLRGYWVGGKVPSLVFEDRYQVDPGEIAWWVGSNGSPWYGVWVDQETGKIYLDVVTHMGIESLALELARARNELAIWDIANGKEVRV